MSSVNLWVYIFTIYWCNLRAFVVTIMRGRASHIQKKKTKARQIGEWAFSCLNESSRTRCNSLYDIFTAICFSIKTKLLVIYWRKKRGILIFGYHNNLHLFNSKWDDFPQQRHSFAVIPTTTEQWHKMNIADMQLANNGSGRLPQCKLPSTNEPWQSNTTGECTEDDDVALWVDGLEIIIFFWF